MNILEITNEDIARLQENKIVFGLLPEMDRKIFGFIGTGNTDRYCSTGFYRCREDSIFQESAVYRIVSNYALPTPTESDIISYLKASEVPPSQWHPAAQEWARKHEGEDIWETLNNGKPIGKCRVMSRCIDKRNHWPHCLRADYGQSATKCTAQIVWDESEPKPEVCVWECFMHGYCRDPHRKQYVVLTDEAKEGLFCPVCGKRIEVKA